MDLARPLAVVAPTLDADVLGVLAAGDVSLTGREIQRRVMAERYWGSLQRPQSRSGDGERRAQVRRCMREMAPTPGTEAKITAVLEDAGAR